MSAGDIIVALVVAAGLSFDFTNGFHDTANAMATTIATGALPPKVAVTIAAILNFAGAFISLTVAATVAEGIVDAGAITPIVILGGVVGAISWNLATWWFGIPSSSSHALIGGDCLIDTSSAGIRAGRQANVHMAIAVARGHASPEDLREAGADIVVADLQELLGAAKRLDR